MCSTNLNESYQCLANTLEIVFLLYCSKLQGTKHCNGITVILIKILSLVAPLVVKIKTTSGAESLVKHCKIIGKWSTSSFISMLWAAFKQLHLNIYIYIHIFYLLIFFCYECNIFVSIGSNTINISLAQWILMTGCFSTMASVSTVLSTHPFLFNSLWVN